jgi:hypothetical protein
VGGFYIDISFSGKCQFKQSRGGGGRRGWGRGSTFSLQNKEMGDFWLTSHFFPPFISLSYVLFIAAAFCLLGQAVFARQSFLLVSLLAILLPSFIETRAGAGSGLGFYYLNKLKVRARARARARACAGLGFGQSPQAWIFCLFSKSPSLILLNKHPGPQKAQARSIKPEPDTSPNFASPIRP